MKNCIPSKKGRAKIIFEKRSVSSKMSLVPPVRIAPTALTSVIFLLLLHLLTVCLCSFPRTNAAPSSEPEAALYSESWDAVKPSIYSYTITNPNKQLQREQGQQQQQLLLLPKRHQQQQQQRVPNNDFAFGVNDKNSINIGKNNKYLNNYNKQIQNYRSGNTNRNLYYTNTNNNNRNRNSNNNNNETNNTKAKSNSDDFATYKSNAKDTISSIAASPSFPSFLSFPSSPSHPHSTDTSFRYSRPDVVADDASSASSLSSLSSATAVPASGCNLDRLAVYKVVLHTYWTRELFPKHFPDWRPTAQWTKTIGRTHNAASALYHLGQQATAGVKQFAETGKTDILDSTVAQQQQHKSGNSFTSFVPSTGSLAKATQEPQKQQQQPLLQHGEHSSGTSSSLFDEFSIPAIATGSGRSEAKFFVDSNHTLVSLMTRIVPSPDWFIGVDSFQLCVGGSWIDTVTIEMDPLDAGTDNGFTFTAPNWPTSPQGVIYRITARYPAHPAGSFFYPKSKRLPPIATFQLIKLKEYDLSEVFNFAEDDRKYETVQTQTHLESEHSHVEMNNELSASIERERQSEVTAAPPSETERDRIRSQLLAKMNPMNNASDAAAAGRFATANLNVVPKNDKHALMQNIAQSYHRRGAGSPPSQTAARATKRRRAKRQRDCRVSHWSNWSACSQACGIGEMHRYRRVIRHGRRGGRPCPALQESKWCGSEQGCHKSTDYFNW